MRITKNVPLATLEVDTEKGKLWINTPTHCLLRACKIEFNKSITEKFSLIDITGNKGAMIKDNSNTLDEFNENLSLFLVDLVQLINFKFNEKKNVKQKVFYKKLLKDIKNYIHNN